MIDIIILIFLCGRIGNTARDKGLKPRQWILYTVLAWLGFEFAGLIIGLLLFGFDKNDAGGIYGLMAFAIACGFGGYLLVKATLEKKPGITDEEINNTGQN